MTTETEAPATTCPTTLTPAAASLVSAVTSGRDIDINRAEDESCQASTPGCCIDHSSDHGPCETW